MKFEVDFSAARLLNLECFYRNLSVSTVVLVSFEIIGREVIQ